MSLEPPTPTLNLSWIDFSINPTINLYTNGLQTLSGNIVKYNQKYLAESTEDRVESKSIALMNMSQAPMSPTVPSAILDNPSNMMLVE